MADHQPPHPRSLALQTVSSSFRSGSSDARARSRRATHIAAVPRHDACRAREADPVAVEIADDEVRRAPRLLLQRLREVGTAPLQLEIQRLHAVDDDVRTE